MANQLRRLPLDLLDEPPAPVRAAMNDVALAALARSVSQVGVINPLAVVERNGRYQVIAGHRRQLAAKAVGLERVPAIIFPTKQVALEAIQLHENIHREDLNPVDEARFFAQLYERCGQDVDAVADLVKERREYIDDRLSLLAGDAAVLEALEHGDISAAVARELNREEDSGYRKMFLVSAVSGGASARLVREWRGRHAVSPSGATAPDPPAAAGSAAPAPGEPDTIFKCWFCGSTEAKHTLKLLYLHEGCDHVARELVRGQLGARAGGGDPRAERGERDDG